VQFAVENEADEMSYFDHYIPPELTEIVVTTHMYIQNNRSPKCLAPLQNMHVVKNGNQ